MSQPLYLNSRFGRGYKQTLPVGRAAARVAAYNRANNIINNIEDKLHVPIHSKALLLVDKSFEIRYIPLLRHLIDIGYFPDSIDIQLVNDDIISVEAKINKYYNEGGRLIFGTQKTSTFFDLRKWFEEHSDALYFNSGFKHWNTQIDDEIPDNMITTTCNYSRITKFIFDNIICNIHKHADFLNGSVFDNIFDFVDDSLPNGQVFNQIVYVSDNSDLRLKNNFIKTLQDYIQTNFSKDTFANDPVTLKTFVLNLNDNNFTFSDELDNLLSENPINSSKFSQSNVKSIFIFDCFDNEKCQNMLNYFSKKEYYQNLIIFNDKFLNLDMNTSLPFNSKFDFTYSFILSLNYSELAYKTSRRIFGDYSTPMPFIDLFSHMLDIFDRVIKSGNTNPVNRLTEYLINSFSIDRNEWHVKPLYLYGLKEIYDENLKIWNFYSSSTIFKKSFNDTSTGTSSTDESWIDTAIDSYPTAPGNTTYSSNNTNYGTNNATFLNNNLNGVSMLFSGTQEITDYTSDLNGFFLGSYSSSTYSGGKNPNSTPSIFGIWKVLTNKGLPINSTAVPSPIQINVTAPSEALIDGTSTNKNYWYHIYNGPISYTYTSYNSYGGKIGASSDTVTIDLDMTYSSDNYLVVFNKGDSYNGIRAPLLIHFTLVANQIVNKQYRIGDVISISSDSVLGTNANASIDSISSDGFTFGVTRFENENTNGITSSTLKQNTGITMSLATDSSNAYMYVNPDITNVANNSYNLWDPSGCYYLALLPSGALVANDYRTGLTFWSSGSGFSNPGPASLRFRVLETTTYPTPTASNPFPSPIITYYIELHLLDTTGAERVKILKNSVNTASLIYPLQLVLTNNRNIAIVNAVGATLWSEATNIYLSLNNGNTIGINGNMYSLNGTYNLALNSSGILNFTNVINNKTIYSITNQPTATYLKFSYTINSSNNATFTLGLYNSSNIQVYNILTDGSNISSTTFDGENNKLVQLPFVAPYTFKISNNGDLIIVDANNNKCWNLGKADKTTVTQDSYDNAGNLIKSEITGLSAVHPRQGDYATIHNPVNPQYSNATATIALVNSDKSIKAIFYDENDSTTRSNIIYEKPGLRSSLITDANDSGGDQNIMPVSNLELYNLTSDNGYYTASIGDDCIVRVTDNRTGRLNWFSFPLALPTTQTIQKCNGLVLDKDDGSLYVSVICENITNSVTLSSNVNYNLAFYASGSSPITVTISGKTNLLQPKLIYTFTPTSSALQLFNQQFSVVTNDTFIINFSQTVSAPISITNEEKFYIFPNADPSANLYSYSLDMQDDGNLCLYKINTDGTTTFMWGSMAWQTNSWDSDAGVIQAFDYKTQYVPPRLISTNGYYYLAMDQGKLGIMKYINNSSYSWVDNTFFKYIGKPFFYSGQSLNVNLTATDTTTNLSPKTVFSSGTLWQNYSNSNTKGYWDDMYNAVNASFSFSNSDLYNLVDNVSPIWVSLNSTGINSSSGGSSGYYDFYYSYNNTTGKTIKSTLWVSVVEKCDVYISGINNNGIIKTVGGTSSSDWKNLWTYDFDLQPGTTTFSFKNTYNSGGRCGLAFICFPKYISSCDLFLDKTGNVNNNGFGKGNLLVKNVTILAEDGTTVTVPGISDLQPYAITNTYNNGGSPPFTMSFEDDGFGGSNGMLTITNSTNTTILSSKADNTTIPQTLFVPNDRNGILNAGVKLYAQQDEGELESFLWSPTAYSFFGIKVDTVNKTQTVCIFDARFTNPVYTFGTPSTYTTLTSFDAISYIMLSSSGSLDAYNILGTKLYNITSSITGYSNFSLKLDDSNVLYILSNNNIIGTLPYNHTWGTFESYILSSGTTKYYNGRILTSSNGNYTLTLDNGSLNINSVNDTSYSSNGTSQIKDINTTTLYANLYTYSGSNPSSAYVIFNIDGVLKVYDSTGIKYTFGTSNIGIPGYKLVLGNTGELAIYDCSIPDALASDSGSINDCSNWSNVYNKFKGNTSSYGWNNYRWLWNTVNSNSGAPPNTTVNFYTTYTNPTTTDINATLWCSADDYLTIYMNGSQLPNTITYWNQIISNVITLKAGTTTFFKFVAKNAGSSNNPAGLIFWCLDNSNTNDATNTLFYSNPITTYCSDGIIMSSSDFGIQTWSSGTAYSETIPYSNYTIDTSDIPENQIVSNEYNFKIPSSSDDSEEYTKIYSPNRLYYLRLEIDGSLSIYLSSSNAKIWFNGRPYSGPNSAARIGFYNGKFGLWDSKGQSYGNTITVNSQYVYVFYLGNDRIMRLVGSDGNSVVFNP